jgi:predicted molibdopterin-dependent oxidoreductase YjgC
MSIGKGRPWQTRQVKTTCSYCGVGCQIELVIKNNHIIAVETAWDGPANHGWTCVKGRFGWDYVHHPDRLTKPKVRRYLLDGGPKPFEALKRVRQTVIPVSGGTEHRSAGVRKDGEDPAWEWVETDWDTALDLAAGKLRQARDTHGPDSIGLLTSAKCLNEENYLMNKLARQVIGTNNIDHCARL